MKWMQANHAYIVVVLYVCVCVHVFVARVIIKLICIKHGKRVHPSMMNWPNWRTSSEYHLLKIAIWPDFRDSPYSCLALALLHLLTPLPPPPLCSAVSWNWEFIVMRLSAQLGCMQHGNEPRQQKIKIDARMLSGKACACVCVCARMPVYVWGKE